MSKFRWGILGPGVISHKFAEGLKVIPDAELYAVGSRDYGRAKEFADKYGAHVAYGSYEELAKDDNIDCIYIGTPHPMHMPNTLLCINNGRNVLCEKPMSMNKKEVQIMIDLAVKKNVFLMEAFWTRFMPPIRKIIEWINQGKIGDIRMIHCDFCYRGDYDPKSRLLDPGLGGGALLDVGCYAICMSTMLLGNNPDLITGATHLGETNVDEQSAMILRYPKGELAVLSTAVRTNTYQNLYIFGTNGSITVPVFWNSSKATLFEEGKEPVYFEERIGNGYNYEAVATMEDIRAGKIENGFMTHADSLAIAEISDKLRNDWGLKYPADDEQSISWFDDIR